MGTSLFLLLPVIISITIFGEVNANVNVSSMISRDHVSVWFDYSVRFYEHEADNAYSKEEIGVMVDLVSTRFRKIVLERAPTLTTLSHEKNAPPHSRTLIPAVVAEHNVKFPERTMEVMVSFDRATSSLSLYTTRVGKISFEVALEMADEANEIHAGTVTTLMMDQRFSAGMYYGAKWSDDLRSAYQRLNKTTSKFPYGLAILLDIRDCGHFRGPLGQKVEDALPYVSTLVFLVRPNFSFLHGGNYNVEVMHKIFITKFEECEKKVKQENKDVKLVPAAVVLSSSDSKTNFPKKTIWGWEMMSKWAEKNNREVIMLEAFDTPLSGIITTEGWWRLKDKAQYEITKDAFVEKISEVNLTSSRSGGGPSTDEDNGSDEDIEGSWSVKGRGTKELKESFVLEPQAIPEAVYILLLLLIVVCTLLVAVVAGLVYGFHVILLRNNNNTLESRIRSPQLRDPGSGVDIQGHDFRAAVLPSTSNGNGYCRSLPGESGDNAGSFLEFSDRSPIVTFKKDQGSERE